MMNQVKCRICNLSTSGMKGLATHLRYKHPADTGKTYYDKYLKTGKDGICVNCGKPTRYLTLEAGYRTYCSCGCSASNPVEKEKKAQTNFKNLGVRYPTQSKKVWNKTVKTNIKKYGVKNAFQIAEPHGKALETIKKKIFSRLASHPDFTPQFKYSEFTKTGIDHTYNFECKHCNKIFSDYVILIDGHPRCWDCFPDAGGSSDVEKEMHEYIKSLDGGATHDNRYRENGVYKYQLDTLVKDRNIGFELNGLYWHSEIGGGKDRKYHIEKTEYFKQKGIRVVHIWDYEWNHKKEIVKSFIANMLGKTESKIHARKCVIKEIDFRTASDFLNGNHMQGQDRSSIQYGLFHNETLVSVMTFRKFKKHFELTRFCSLLNTNVVGGFSRLLSHHKKANELKIITYADKRYSLGNLYLSHGFVETKNNPPSYWYTVRKKYNSLIHKQNFMKKRIPNCDWKKTEWENMIGAGFDRVWDCGTLTFVLDNKKGGK